MLPNVRGPIDLARPFRELHEGERLHSYRGVRGARLSRSTRLAVTECECALPALPFEVSWIFSGTCCVRCGGYVDDACRCAKRDDGPGLCDGCNGRRVATKAQL
jgi:hypothetical protein